MEPFFGNDDEEEECRVCRGPAEEDRPLRKPCRCSGSIGLIHQDCLQSWLNQRGTNTCELCKTPFRFAARYAEGTPDRLTTPEVLFGVSHRAVKAWLPFGIRVLFAAFLWLGVTPLATTMLYHCWVSRPDAIFSRIYHRKLIWIDLVTGYVLAACIIVSFLSLMSFADFLRAEWQRPRPRDRQQHVNPPPPDEAAVDNSAWDFAQQQILRRGEIDSRSSDSDDGEKSWNTIDEVDSDSSYVGEDDMLNDDDDDDDIILRQDNSDDENEANAALEEPNPPPIAARGPEMVPNNFPLEDQVDVDINIALDEVLGLRGPFHIIIRNLVWLLAFNAVYLGIFVFIPRTVGSTMGALLFSNSTTASVLQTESHIQSKLNDWTLWLFPLNSTLANATAPSYGSLSNLLSSIELESATHHTAFRLRDMIIVVVGYLALALSVVLCHFLWYLSQRVGLFQSLQGRLANNRVEVVNDLVDGPFLQQPHPGMDQHEEENLAEVVPPGVAIGVALKATTAIVKVGVLLFVKMFILPVLLGIALDFSTMSVTGLTFEDQISFAGKDIFSSILLHWVAGITFMLLVTVSVLQLREVTHPDLLAQVIRPQEPQPDLLGNLMNESIATHGKRMVLSLLIYAMLLCIQVYIPIRFFMTYLVPRKFAGFFCTKFAFLLTPQLQAPLELLTFHLSMLALLEYYKNGLGGLQHRWLKFISGCLGLTDCIVPNTISQFGKIGKYPVFIHDGEVDNFWYELALGSDRVHMIETNLQMFDPDPTGSYRYLSAGESKLNGERILRSSRDYIRLPQRLPGTARRNRSVLLPTKLGQYRLKQVSHGNHFNIQLWEEVPGNALSRPPEGWDDLAPRGGAEDQGRWAWGNENKSLIERGVATRRPFFSAKLGRPQKVVMALKLSVLVVLSWLFSTTVLFLMAGAPLAAGRLLFYLLRLPDKWTHDPFAFFVGFLILSPIVRNVAWLVNQSDVPWLQRFGTWLDRFTFPSRRKIFVLSKAMFGWLIIAPLLVGVVYEVALVKTADWFEDPRAGRLPLLRCWFTGSALLYIWADFAEAGVLTREFRQNLFGRPNGADAPQRENFDHWQGKHGRVSRFFTTLINIAMHWNWELVDNTVLNIDFAWPVIGSLAFFATIPALCTIVLSRCFALTGSMTALMYRTSLIIDGLYVGLQIWQGQLKVWFERAHRAARDDRYLVGEILLNHGEG